MINYIYTIHSPERYDKKTDTKNHVLYYTDENICVVPRAFDSTCVNPKTFYDLKKKLDIDYITILDKTTPSVKECYIADHVNRAGFNFLIAKTPINKLPVFPSMSNIYNEIDGLRPIVVHTVGPDRFVSVEDPKIIISESVGLISPLWHYVKTKVYACTDR